MGALLSVLADVAGAVFEGNGNCVIQAVNSLADAKEGDISFLTNERYRAALEKTKASAVILKPEHVSHCPLANRIISSNPYLCYALIAQHLARDADPFVAGMHPSAIIDESADVATEVQIDAHVVIGKHVQIAEGVKIGAGTVIGDNCIIGKDTRLMARVTLYHETIVGERCLIHSGAVLGSDGFGFANDKGEWIKIPQTGRAVIGDDVEIGANTAVDRGAIQDTVIENGVKLDNLIQVAHNVSVGKTAIAGKTGIAGSATIGEGCTIGGGAVVLGHLELKDNVHVSAMTLVTKTLAEPGQYTGNIPAMPHKLWAKNTVYLKKLDELAKKIKKLEKQLDGQE